MSQRLRLGELLVEAGVIDEAQRQRALEAQRETGRRLGAMLLEMEALDEETLIRTLARQLSLPVVWLDGKRIRPEVLELVPQELVYKHGCLPVQLDAAGSTLMLAMEDPLDEAAIEAVAARVGMPVKPVLACVSELSEAIRRHAPVDPGDSLACAEFVNGNESGPDLLSVQDTVRSALPSAGGDPGVAPEAAASDRNALVLRALTQLLVEKGVFTRKELIDRLGALDAAASEAESEG